MLVLYVVSLLNRHVVPIPRLSVVTSHGHLTKRVEVENVDLLVYTT
jgi:hypothetical protein